MKKVTIIILIVCILTGILLYVNRDLFRYEQIFVYRRMFSPEIDSKGDYILSTEQIPLKPGTYQMTIEGNFSSNGSGYFMTDAEEEKFLSSDFPSEGTITQQEFTVSGNTKQVRFGVSWDPVTKGLSIDRFIIRSDHVLYKSSLLKHAVISAAILMLGAILLLRFIFPKKYRDLFPHLSKPENERMILMIIFLTLLTAAPFYPKDTYVTGDDFYYHMRHLKGVAASLKAGHFPVRILLDWIENYGYGSGFYYPNILLTFPAVLILCGFHEIAAYEIFTSICTFFSLLTMFLTIRRISRSEKTAHAGIIIYAFAAYRLVDIYYRAALGEIQAFVFLPLIILGLYEIFNDHPERWWIFGIAFTGLLWSHVISLALAAVFTTIWAIIHARRIFTDRRIFLALFKSVIFTLLLGTWFLLPMAEQSATNRLKINMIMFSADMDPYGSYTDAKNLFLFFNDWNYEVPARSVYPGWHLLIIPLLRILFLRRKGNDLLKLADELLIYGLISMIMCTNLFPWNIFIQFLYRIQFAWRFMMISTVLMSVSCGIYVSFLFEKICPNLPAKIRLLLLFILCSVCGAPILIEACTNHAYSMDYYHYTERSNFLSGSEYLPEKLEREMIEKTGDHVISEDPGFEMTSFVRKGLSVTWDYTLPESSSIVTMRVPLVYYTGYRGFITGPDEKTHEIPISKNEVGLITVTNEDISSGRINVRYVKTLMQHIGDSISLLTLIGCILFALRKKRNHL